MKKKLFECIQYQDQSWNKVEDQKGFCDAYAMTSYIKTCTMYNSVQLIYDYCYMWVSKSKGNK
jgi:Rad3-related DNA helicase